MKEPQYPDGNEDRTVVNVGGMKRVSEDRLQSKETKAGQEARRLHAISSQQQTVNIKPMSNFFILQIVLKQWTTGMCHYSANHIR